MPNVRPRTPAAMTSAAGLTQPQPEHGPASLLSLSKGPGRFSLRTRKPMLPYTPAVEAALIVLCLACGVGMFAAVVLLLTTGK